MDNIEFENLDAAGKRVAIAKDVLAQIAASKVCPTRGTWVAVDSKELPSSFADVVEKKVCQSCAIGTTFLSLARLKGLQTAGFFNHYSRTFDIRLEAMLKALEPYFPREQLALMEVAFEGHAVTYDICDGDIAATETSAPLSHAERQAAISFGGWDEDEERVDISDTDTLERIMLNIIDNHGEFVPPQAE